MKKKYWQILLTTWRSKNRDGLTIPFIIGSQKYLPSSHNTQDIEGLILDIVSNTEVEVYISYCMNINELILGLRDDSKKK